MRPLDNMQCPAVAVEVSPLRTRTRQRKTAATRGRSAAPSRIRCCCGVTRSGALLRLSRLRLPAPVPKPVPKPLTKPAATATPADSEDDAMIPRYQRVLFAILLGSAPSSWPGLLIWLHQRNFAAVKNADNTPIEAPVYSASEDVPLLLANDADGSVKSVTRIARAAAAIRGARTRAA